MQEITIQDPFGQALAKYSEGLCIGLEIGGGTGDGSTQCIKTKTLFSIENDPQKIPHHKRNMDLRDGGIAVHGNSTEPEKWMQQDEIISFYNSTKTNLNRYSLETIFSWIKQSEPYLGNYKGSAIEGIWAESGARFDFILVDGHEFSGKPDLLAALKYANKNCVIALDDVNAAKNYTNYFDLKKTSELLCEDLSFRNGWAVFRISNPKSAI